MADLSWNYQFGDDDEENDLPLDSNDRWNYGTRDGIIFLIDVTEDMFDEGDSTSHFQKCVQCAKTVIQNKIISSERDLVAIVFFGTEKTHNSSEFKHIFVLHDLLQPGADIVIQLESLLNEANHDNFSTKFGHNTGFSLSDVFWACSNIFSTCSQKLGFKRIMLFTCRDDPHRNNAQLKRQAASKAEDLHHNGIDIELFHLNPRNGESFDVTSFYKDVLFSFDETMALPDPTERLEELLIRVNSKDHKKRAVARIPFNLGEGFNFSVGVYNLVRPCQKTSSVKLYRKTNEIVRSVRRTFSSETGEILMPQDVMKFMEFGGKKITFNKDEVTEMKQFFDPGLKLLGFKSEDFLKKYFYVKPSSFLHPDEQNVSGSTAVFTALLKKCLEKNVVAICSMTPRKNTPPRIVALFPQDEEFDEHNIQLMPAGFHVIHIPYADDFRKIKIDENRPRANNDQVDCAKAFIKKLQFPFSCESFENPALQTHYLNIEAMALDRDKPDDVIDHTLPDDETMERRAGPLISAFKESVFPNGYVAGGSSKTAKRKNPEVKTDMEKKPKVEVDVEVEAKCGRLNKLTVVVLKEAVKKFNIHSVSSKKGDLIDAINQYFGI